MQEAWGTIFKFVTIADKKPPLSDPPTMVFESVRFGGNMSVLKKKTLLNDHLYEGRFTPTNADGKRISRNIYVQTREECEEKLAVLIVEMKAEIKAEKERRKQAASA